MKNWGVDEKIIKKKPKKYRLWRLEQLVNFGTDGEKISSDELKRDWNNLTLDEDKKRFLGFILWGKKFLARRR